MSSNNKVSRLERNIYIIAGFGLVLFTFLTFYSRIVLFMLLAGVSITILEVGILRSGHCELVGLDEDAYDEYEKIEKEYLDALEGLDEDKYAELEKKYLDM